MELSTASQALRTGDLEGVLSALPGDDTITDTLSCPCGQDNTLTIVRIGHTVLMWGNAPLNHGSGFSELDVRGYASEADAVAAMESFRAELALVAG